MEDLRALVNFDTVIINILAENKARASYTLTYTLTTYIKHIVCVVEKRRPLQTMRV